MFAAQGISGAVRAVMGHCDGCRVINRRMKYHERGEGRIESDGQPECTLALEKT